MIKNKKEELIYYAYSTSIQPVSDNSDDLSLSLQARHVSSTPLSPLPCPAKNYLNGGFLD